MVIVFRGKPVKLYLSQGGRSVEQQDETAPAHLLARS